MSEHEIHIVIPASLPFQFKPKKNDYHTILALLMKSQMIKNVHLVWNCCFWIVNWSKWISRRYENQSETVKIIFIKDQIGEKVVELGIELELLLWSNLSSQCSQNKNV